MSIAFAARWVLLGCAFAVAGGCDDLSVLRALGDLGLDSGSGPSSQSGRDMLGIDLAGSDTVEPPPFSYPAAVLADSPLGYWRVADGSGTTALDASANARHATYSISGVTYGRAGALVAQPNAAVRFTAPAGQVGGLVLPSTIAPWSGDFSVEAWVRPHAAAPTGAYASIFVWETYPSTGFRLGWMSNLRPRFWTTETGGSTSLEASAPLSLSDYKHVVVTRAGSSLRVYLDGVEVASTTTLGYVAPPASGFNCFGACEGIAADADYDELAVYGSALSAARVRAHFMAR